MDVLPSVPSVIRLKKIAEVVEQFNTKWGNYTDRNTKTKLIAFIDWAELYLKIIDKIQKDFAALTYKTDEAYDIMQENLLRTRLDTLKLGAQIIGELSKTFRVTTFSNSDYRKAYAKLLSDLTGCTDTAYSTDYKEFVLGEIREMEYIASHTFGKNSVAVMSDQKRNITRQLSRSFLEQLQKTKKEFEENCIKFYKIMRDLTY